MGTTSYPGPALTVGELASSGGVVVRLPEIPRTFCEVKDLELGVS